MDHTNVNILAFILYYDFARCYHGENRVKDIQNLSVVFLIIAHESTVVSK